MDEQGAGDMGSNCVPLSSMRGTSVSGSTSGPPEVVYGSAAADVERVVIILRGGGTIRAQAVSAGAQKFFAFALSHGQHTVRWQAYDAAGHKTSSGPAIMP